MADTDELARLEARIPRPIKERIERAAELTGHTVTGFLIATAGEDARRVVEDAEIMRLSQKDQTAFAKALIDPPAPSARLRRAAKHHAELIERR
jgi:uncharacterized protein (DUF1778 family)